MKLISLTILVLCAAYASAQVDPPASSLSLGSFPPEKPTCAVRCVPLTQIVCAGPKTGCGKLKSFINPCMLGGWNCNHKSHQYAVKYDGPCYPDDTIIGGPAPIVDPPPPVDPPAKPDPPADPPAIPDPPSMPRTPGTPGTPGISSGTPDTPSTPSTPSA